ncbi:hypothetical protein GGS21DRAFT_261026 [Xylaria nigripes]|nr:hypothetical protein GGS21DRAFT_261026 [Xylaria nigripes]
MGRPPAYIFVVRHGNRLDAADKQWHVTSPTPYDPPLTYGGWVHSRMVGARIATILREHELATAAVADTPPKSEPTSSSTSSSVFSSSPPYKRRSFRIVIHSSPFLRCVQTSVAISAGLASSPIKSAESSRSRPATSQSARAFFSVNPTTSSSTPHDTSSYSTVQIEKSVLRLDAFLGEWLCPDYFEHITPPPQSALMLATAKAELLRRSSYHDYPHFNARVPSGLSSQLWNSPPNRNGTDGPLHGHGFHNASALDSLSQLADSLPAREAQTKDERGTSQENKRAPGYVYPVPTYAISTSEPIPRGYVAHARDACVSVDYQWDSSRECLSWGDGGQLPEEWPKMHQRFRKGLGQLVHWYSSTENPGKMVTKTTHASHSTEVGSAVNDKNEDDEVEDVVVLVSHGAGCNALIGAITDQPVLADVAMSSLTMARRRPGFDYHRPPLTRRISASSLDAALASSSANTSDLYEIGLFANTDHLVTPSPPPFHRKSSLSGSNSSTHVNSDYVSPSNEAIPGSTYASQPGGSRSRLANASLGSMRRPPGGPTLVIKSSVFNENTGGIAASSGGSGVSSTRPNRSASGTWGLWSPTPRDEEPSREPESLMFLDFSHERLTEDKKVKEVQMGHDGCVSIVDADKSASAAAIPSEAKRTFLSHDEDAATEHTDDEERDKFDEDTLPSLRSDTNNGGLWGLPRPPGEVDRFRDFSASKRRWTFNDR